MNKLLLIISFVFISANALAQFGAPWEKEVSDTLRTHIKTFRESQHEFYEYWKDKDSTVKGSGYKVFKRWEDYWSTRLLEDGTVPSTSKYWKEYEQMENSFHSQRAQDLSTWKSIGPFSHTGNGSWSPGQGRVNVIAEDPSDSKIIYLGAPNGGLWRSTNDGATWTALTDKLPRIGVGAIAIDPKNSKIIYIGMGDDEARDCPSIGVLKSTDGGNTWNKTGLVMPDTGGINYKCTEVFIDPNNSSVLWAATSIGLHRSTDAGATWSKRLNDDIKGMCLKPGNSSIVYAVTKDKFYKSTDGGINFTPITSGLPTSAGRFSIDVSEANPEYVYLLASTTGNAYQGIYRSTNSATSFSAVNTNTNVFENTQSWYTMPIGVSSTDANVIFTGCLNVWRSTNGGSSSSRINNWNSVNTTYTHADIHFIKYFKNRLYIGSDGGIYRSINNGSSFTDLTKGVAISQFYRISGSPTNKNILVGGLQDNGGYGWNGTNWNNYYGADGMDCAVSLTNSSTMYGFIQNGGTLYRSTNSGQSGSQYATGKAGNWITPIVADKDGSLIVGFADLWRLSGTNWTKISTFAFGGKINGVEISPVNSKIIYAFVGKNLYKTTNGGSSFSNITSGLSGTITSVEADYADDNKVWVTVGGWVSGTHVFYSSNGGTSWTNITKNLPNFPTNIIKQEVGNTKDALYVGLDIGVFYTDNTLNTWVPFMQDLPNSSVTDLEINEKSNIIRASTFGRGVWESGLYSSPNSISTVFSSQSWSVVYPNPSTGSFYIQLQPSALNQQILVTVYNLLGEKVYDKQLPVNVNNLPININSLSKGVYILNLKVGSEEWNGRIIKQ